MPGDSSPPTRYQSRPDRHNDHVPTVVRPDPPPPLSVAVATHVFGSEVLVALIRIYRERPRSRAEAARALDLPKWVVATNTKLLIDAAVITTASGQIRDGKGRTRHGERCVVDELRVNQLNTALMDYIEGKPSN